MSNDFWLALDYLVKECEIVIDRPKNSMHPKFDYVYQLDYGFLKGTVSQDAQGIDVWYGSLGTKNLDAIVCTIDLLKKDSEIKLLIACTEKEKKIVLDFHNKFEFMKGILIRR